MMRGALSVLVIIALTGCSAQGGGHDLVKTASGQTCDLDTAAICNAVRKVPVSGNVGEINMDERMREQNYPATVNEQYWYQVPGGSMVEVECDIRTRDSSVIYAHLLKGPQFTDHDVEYARQQGFCR